MSNLDTRRQCSTCHTFKDACEFAGGKRRRNYCKTCDKESQARRYKQRKTEYHRLKSQLTCEMCGETHAACLSFHHVDPGTKSFCVGERAGHAEITAEMAKCKVLCANCHAKEHFHTSYDNPLSGLHAGLSQKCRHILKIKQWYHDFKRTLTCSVCPENHPQCLHFHHIDPSDKVLKIAAAVARGWSVPRLLAEMAKCVVLCGNCHAKEHW